MITLPPLRARAEDILGLAEHFGRRMAAELGWPSFPSFSAAAKKQLREHSWPGNVRELKNTVERSLYRWGDPVTPIDRLILDPFDSPWRPKGSLSTREANLPVAVEPSALPTQSDKARDVAAVADLRAAVAEFERDILAAALERCRYNQRETASALALSYDQLRHCLRRHGMLNRSEG